MPDEERERLLDACITALLNDEEWRPLLGRTGQPDIEELMVVAQAVHWTAGKTPKPGRAERFRMWTRVRSLFDRAAPYNGISSMPARVILSGFTSLSR